MQTRITNAETTANDAKAESSAATNRIALNQNEWSTFKTNMESTLTNNSATIAVLGGQIASLDIDNKINTVRTGLENSIAAINIPSTNSIAAELKTLGFMKETDLTVDKLSTLGFAKSTEVATQIAESIPNTSNFLTAEDVDTKITTATTGLVKEDNLETLVTSTANNLGFLKSSDVERIASQKVASAFGVEYSEGETVNVGLLKSGLEQFTSSTLLNTGILQQTVMAPQMVSEGDGTVVLDNVPTTESITLLKSITDITSQIVTLREAIAVLQNQTQQLAEGLQNMGSGDTGDEGNSGFTGLVGNVNLGNSFSPITGLTTPAIKNPNP